MSKPTFQEFKEYVNRHHKRVGLRMLYKKYDVPEGERENYRRMWDLVETEKNASEKQSTEESYGHRAASPGETVREESGVEENVEEPVA